MKKLNNNSWYSVILSILLVWFMLILAFWIFNLVSRENRDSRVVLNYLKAYSAAEWWVELALLESKNNNYFLSSSELSSSEQENIFKKYELFYPKLNYQINSQTKEIIDREIKSGEFMIIPLNQAKNIKLDAWLLWENLIWNIISWTDWITWKWNFETTTLWNKRTINSWLPKIENITVYDFLNSLLLEESYLLLQNIWSDDLSFNLNSQEFFTSEELVIISSAEIDWLKQNLQVKLDNSQYLNLLKYVVFSSN